MMIRMAILIIFIFQYSFGQGVESSHGSNGFVRNTIGSNGYANLSALNSAITSTATLINGIRWSDTTIFPQSAYNGGYLTFNGFTQHLQSSYHTFFDLIYSQTDSFRISFKWKYSSSKSAIVISNYNVGTGGGWYIAQNLNFGGGQEFYHSGSAGGVQISASIDADTLEHETVVIFTKSNSTLRSWVDGVLKYTHTSYAFNDGVQSTSYSLCIGNTAELGGTSNYTDSYSYSVQTYSYRGGLGGFTFGKNDSSLVYSFNQVNTQNFIPIRKIGGVTQRPIYPLEHADRWGAGTSPSNPLVLKNGISAGIDSMDATQYRSGGLKTDYRDCYGSMSSLQSFNGQLMTEGFGGEVVVYNGTLYGCGNFNVANGTTGVRSNWDSAKGVVRWNPNTNEWEQLGYGLVTASGSSGTMFMWGWNNKMLAVGYDVTAVGVGTINYVAMYDSATNAWSAMESGFNDVAFSGASGYGNAYAGGFFTTANSRNVRRIAQWNPTTSKWDSLKGGLNAVPYVIFPDSSSGERLLIIGGAQDSSREGGVSTYHKGIVVWSVDSNKYKSFNNLNTTAGSVYKILKHDGWYYFLGDFTGITDGATTTTSLGLARWKQGIGLQNIGTGIYAGVSGAGVSSAVMHNDILYIGGSFSRINGMWSMDFGAINLLTNAVVDMGYGAVEKRPEGLCVFQNKIIGIGDNFTANGKQHWIAFSYDPTLNP